MRTIDISNPANLGALKSGATLNYVNFGKSGMKFTLACPRIDSSTPYAYMEEVTLLYKGVKVLEGYVTECKQVLQGSNYVWQVSIYDRWWFLENSLMLSKNGLNMFFRESPIGLFPNVVSVKVCDTLKMILDRAVESKAIEAYDISRVDSEAPIDNFEATGSYADVLGAIKDYRPNLIAYFDYSRALTTLVIADHENAQSYTLDVGKNALESIELVARYDLVSKAVGIVYVSTTQAAAMISYPPGADLSQPGSVIHKIQVPQQTNSDDKPEDDKKKGIDSPMWNFTKQSMEVKGRELPKGVGEGRDFWVEKMPVLGEIKNIYFGNIDKKALPVEENASYLQTATNYELVSGSISEKCKTVRWCKVRLRQWIELRGIDPPLNCRHIFTKPLGDKHWGGTLTWDGITTNVKKKSYTISPEGTGPEESDEPPPETEDKENEDPGDIFDAQSIRLEDICKRYFDSTQIVPWDGTVTSNNPPASTEILGCNLCISGGRKEWVGMNTAIQSVSLDTFTGKLIITTGAPDHIGFDTMIERSRVLDNKSKSSDDSRKKGLTDDDQNQDDMNFQWDNRAKQIPEAPTISPNGQVVQGEIDDGFEFGFQVRLIKDQDGRVINSMMKHGMIVMANKVFKSNRKEDEEKDWKETNITSGEIWIKLSFTGGTAQTAGKFIGMGIVSSGSSNVPFSHSNPATLVGYNVPAPVYYFHVATIKDGNVTQYLVGSAYLLVEMKTDYPYGPVL